jgi:uncharacterized protein YecE (DUF72 family)
LIESPFVLQSGVTTGGSGASVQEMSGLRPRGDLFIGTAGWGVASQYSAHFCTDGSHLARYATRLNAAEINSSFYRSHRRVTYERWAASVPEYFRFSVKLPKEITHDRRLRQCEAQLDRFTHEVAEPRPRGGKR